ncbi:hypothetical protein [Streptomyces shenzhenensis]|uniref:hypothetical protein n=1 Tax=Streptomyces shenzhenensis TaxID=943815 RepID=UPI0015F0E77E|nr:hypothetical protein [Streptomyces shenzhenensis]
MEVESLFLAFVGFVLGEPHQHSVVEDGHVFEVQGDVFDTSAEKPVPEGEHRRVAPADRPVVNLRLLHHRDQVIEG